MLVPQKKIYLAHVISYADGKRKGPGAMQDGALLNRILVLDKSSNETLIPRDQLDAPVSRIAAVLLKAKIEWFFLTKKQ